MDETKIDMKTPEQTLKSYPELRGFMNDSEWHSMIEAMKEYAGQAVRSRLPDLWAGAKILHLLVESAKQYRLDYRTYLECSKQTHELSNEQISQITQPEIDAILVDFINYISACNSLTYRLKTDDIYNKPNAQFLSPDKNMHIK